ncbi:MAG TPA: hydantoinase/oxoprolinase family protein, partial [Propylenella sp.]|nr:hydantoinase/oxoprolinase family protein [Propylenella sp.]
MSGAPRSIGIDTGGTYTDAVIFSQSEGVLAKAKALTTKHDLSIGIGEAVDTALRLAKVPAEEVAMVAMSTTLATNAIVERQGDRVGLVLIGFQQADLNRWGLAEALGGDPLLTLAGGHDAHGSQAAALDVAPAVRWLEAEASTVSAFAVAGQFSTANPGHELAVRAFLAERARKPVICSHEISARLNAPRRALTALLNARLIGIVDHLIDATQHLLQARSIAAPIMVVKGDGSLISADEARCRPIETILSGPAASIVGAGYLTGLSDALVADIGGTTTDVALLKDGKPRLDP